MRFLENGGLGEPVERIDTHGAHILLGRERAWKMKRAVRFSFMDLSTLARREAAIRAELELNRRTAPQLYEAVMPVTRADDGALALDGLASRSSGCCGCGASRPAISSTRWPAAGS